MKYSDSLLRKSTKALSETDIDEKLNASITVFKYLADKDIYQGVSTSYVYVVSMLLQLYYSDQT